MNKPKRRRRPANNAPATPPAPPERLNAEQLEIIRKVGGATHVFYTEAFGHRIEKAFGVRVLGTFTANTGEFKGLEVDDVGPNAKVTGASSHDVAETLARALGAEGAPGYMMGRGSRQRAAIQSIARLYDLDTGERRAKLSSV